MEQYFSVVRRELERHGGTVEKFIGDAAMAVFGIPVVHDDDALRAVRAAVDMRTALGGLNRELEERHGVRLAIRTGVNTGEVVAGDPTDRQSFATGAAVATAQRLEAAARSGEILLGDSTYRLVSNAVLVEPMEPLELKGKTEPVRAWRLLGVVEGAAPFPRRLDVPMVGREPSSSRSTPSWRPRAGSVDADWRRSSDRRGSASRGSGTSSSHRPAGARLPSSGAASPTARGSLTGRCAGSSSRRPAASSAAGSRSSSPGQRTRTASPSVSRAPSAPRRGARRRGDLLGGPSVPRASGARRAGHRRDRRAPVGRTDLPRSPRIPRRLDSGRADPPRRARPPRAARGTPDLDDDERTPDRARPAFERRIHGWSVRSAARRSTRRSEDASSRAPRATHCSSSRCSLSPSKKTLGNRSRRRSRRCSPRASTG